MEKGNARTWECVVFPDGKLESLVGRDEFLRRFALQYRVEAVNVREVIELTAEEEFELQGIRTGHLTHRMGHKSVDFLLSLLEHAGVV